MKTAKEVSDLIETLKAQGNALSDIAWKAALACVGWAYVFGARGQYCDPANRRSAFGSNGAEHPTIKSACKNFNGSDKVVGACSTCKWYPGGRTRFFDCRGFTYWILKQVYGWELMGAGATSQWSNGSNWKAKGEIATMPADTLCCLFVHKNNKMEHTGFGFNSETVECSSGVQYFSTRNKKWTHWAVPACVDGSVTPVPSEPEKGTATVTGKRVALRKEPSTSSAIITRINTGETVKLEDPPPIEWDYVSYNGKTGWMMKEFLKENT